MRTSILTLVFLVLCGQLLAQSNNNNSLPSSTAPNTENIFEIKDLYLSKVLHNPADKETTPADNDLEGFDRWFNFVLPRCYPSGNMPRPDVLLKEYEKQKSQSHNTQRTTLSGVGSWQPVGPMNVPSNFFGIGRINCVVIDPVDTATLYIGAACGGVFISHDAGTTWTSNSDNFPSLSIADIAVNPRNTDTIYAATGDGYGFEYQPGNIFWGGLYSAGIMMSADGGATWNPTSFSYLQSNRQIIQKLLIQPNQPNILLAATRTGIFRTTDAGVTWTNVYGEHVISMAFRPGQPDTVYAIDTANLLISYDAGATWNVEYYGVNGGNYMRSTLAVSPIAPNDVWILEDNDSIILSRDGGNSFAFIGNPGVGGYFASQGYYDRVFVVSPNDSNFLIAGGVEMTYSTDGSITWNYLDSETAVHPDHHSIVFNPKNPNTIYDCNDGGIVVSNDGGNSFFNIANGVMISQIYWMGSSLQTPYLMLCGLQDNGSFYNNGSGGGWVEANVPLADGQACAIHPLSDYIQVASYQYGSFLLSTDQGATFNPLSIPGAFGFWTAPVALDPFSMDTMYFGMEDIYATYDQGATFTNLTGGSAPFSNPSFPGSTALILSPSNTNVLYASDFAHILRTTDAGATWVDVTGALPTDSVSLYNTAVDGRNPMLVYAVMSGYNPGEKVYVSTTGGTTWSNISGSLPNIPVDCITTDSLVPGALFIGTDMGVYYRDSSMTDWAVYASGLPNVVVDHIDINGTIRKVRAATYGRGIWECDMLPALSVPNVKNASAPLLQVLPNPTTTAWNLVFAKQKPTDYTIKLMDVAGKVILKAHNTDHIDASKLASGIYDIEVQINGMRYNFKAVRQ